MRTGYFIADSVNSLPESEESNPAAIENKPTKLELDLFFNYSLDLLVLVGFDNLIKQVSPSFERILGWTKEEAIAKPFHDFLHPDDIEKTQAEVTAHETGKNTIQFENRYRCKDGSYRWISWNSHPLIEKQIIVGIGRDITDHKKAEEALNKSEAELRAYVTTSTDAVYNMNPDWSEMRQLHGQNFIADTNEPDRCWIEKYIHPDDEQRVMSVIKHAIETKSVFELEHRVITVDGSLGWTFSRAIPLLDKNGRIIEWFGTAKDVTERKKAEDATARQAELIDLSPDAIIVRKLDGTITFWSKGAERLYGWTKEEAIGQDVNVLLKTQLPQSLKEIQNELKIKGKWSGEIVHICKDGNRLVMQSYWLGKLGSDGKIVEVLESNVDITARIQMQLKLEESAVRLEEYANQMEALANQRAAQLKDAERLATIGATAGMVGHDIRNPLQAITGDVYLAKTELASIPESEEKKSALESLQEIEKNTDYINKIVADLQDFARPLKPNIEEVDLKLIIEDLLKKNGLPENVKVSVKVESDARKIVADSTFVNRVMYNLVNNAVQAMPNGGKLTLNAYKEANDVLIIVKDTGVGIPEAVKGKLFTPMFTTKAKGQGFGLPVIKRMTEALGGTVTFESQEGKGTSFIVRLPTARAKR
jgi:PAS domain S-box-containing protein